MASCQQYESKPPLPQGQIVHVSCRAYTHRDMGVVDDKEYPALDLKRIRLVPRSSINPTETWLKVDKGSKNTFIFRQPLLGKGVGTDKDEVTLVDQNKIVTWIAIEEDGKVCSESEYVYIRRADDEDGKVCKVWTAVPSEKGDDIKIKLRIKVAGNQNQLWKIQDLIEKKDSENI